MYNLIYFIVQNVFRIIHAIVYVDKEITPETKEKLTKAFNKDDVSIRPNGVLDNITLHYPNEAARHKLLDVVGDLALIGTRLKAKIIANKPGHQINTNFAKKLSKQIAIAKRKNVPEFDLTKEPITISMISSKFYHIAIHFYCWIK